MIRRQLRPKRFNPKLQKHRARGQDFWQRFREEWKALPPEQQTAWRYIELFNKHAGLHD